MLLFSHLFPSLPSFLFLSIFGTHSSCNYFDSILQHIYILIYAAMFLQSTIIICSTYVSEKTSATGFKTKGLTMLYLDSQNPNHITAIDQSQLSNCHTCKHLRRSLPIFIPIPRCAFQLVISPAILVISKLYTSNGCFSVSEWDVCQGTQKKPAQSEGTLCKQPCLMC